MSVIHLVDGTYAGLEWIDSRTKWSTRSARLARLHASSGTAEDE